MMRKDMANQIEIKIPDIGGAAQVDVIEVLVNAGDMISKDTPLVTLESDKASMEIPSPVAGQVSQILTKVGDKVSEGDVILLASVEQELPTAENPVSLENPINVTANHSVAMIEAIEQISVASLVDVVIPDIGGATEVDVIDILVKDGDSVQKDQSLITLEGDKATMDIPCPYEGKVIEINVKLGDKVAQGTLILKLETTSSTSQAITNDPVQKIDTASSVGDVQRKSLPVAAPTLSSENQASCILAGPAVRRMARELGVDLSFVKGTGRKSRITTEDVQAYVKMRLSEKPVSSGFTIPATPQIDFSQFGGIEVKPLNKIKKLTGSNVHRSWTTIPHVTQFDEADITDLEAFRKSETESNKNSGYKLTVLAFVCKVVSKALDVYPQFNASLDATGENLIYKKYCNIGIAVETPNGLVVPVIKNVNQLSVSEIALEMGRLSSKARDKGLMPNDMSGGCFTISSLGGIGGTAFTPIVNSPEVAILGLSRSAIKPVFINNEFIPKLMLPLSLSYDHRVIDGAEAARFTRFICDTLSDIRRILL